MNFTGRSLLAWVALGAGVALHAQSVIELQSLVGTPGSDARSVAADGQVVNHVGLISNSGATALTANAGNGLGFDFNTGFGDGVDRVIGSAAGGGAVFVDRKTDSASTSPLILDTNGDLSFSGELALTGLGMHSDAFITFDLAAIRVAKGLAPDTEFSFTGLAGIANTSLALTSGAVLVDGVSVAVFDWSPGTAIANRFSVLLPSSARYLTLAGLSGADGDNFYAHVGFANVQLAAVPEPSTWGLLGLGIGTLWLLRRRSLV